MELEWRKNSICELEWHTNCYLNCKIKQNVYVGHISHFSGTLSTKHNISKGLSTWKISFKYNQTKKEHSWQKRLLFMQNIFIFMLPVHDPCVKHQLGFSASLVSHDSWPEHQDWGDQLPVFQPSPGAWDPVWWSLSSATIKGIIQMYSK